MLFIDLCKSTPSTHADAANVEAAKDDMLAFADTMNQRKRERDNDQANRALASSIDDLEIRLAKRGRHVIQRGDILLVIFGRIFTRIFQFFQHTPKTL